MVFRCTRLVAGLSLLIGGGGSLLFPAAYAGEPIEFSAPAIPLAIPQVEVETRQSSQKLFNISGGEPMASDPGFAPPQAFTVVRSRKPQNDPWNKDLWNKDPWSKDSSDTDQFQNREKDQNNLFALPATQGPPTNMTGFFKMQRDEDVAATEPMLLHRDSQSEDSQGGDRYDSQKKFGDTGLLGRDTSSSDDKDSLLLKLFRNPSGAMASGFNAGAFINGRQSGVGLVADSDQEFRLPGDDFRTSPLPTEFGSINSVVADTRRSDPPVDSAQGFIRAWQDTPAPARASDTRHYSVPDQLNPSRVVAPNRPVNLPWIRRPSDPNPF